MVENVVISKMFGFYTCLAQFTSTTTEAHKSFATTATIAIQAKMSFHEVQGRSSSVRDITETVPDIGRTLGDQQGNYDC